MLEDEEMKLTFKNENVGFFKKDFFTLLNPNKEYY